MFDVTDVNVADASLKGKRLMLSLANYSTVTIAASQSRLFGSGALCNSAEQWT